MLYYLFSHSFNLNVTLFILNLQADHAIANVSLQFMDALSAPRYIIPIILYPVGRPQFQTLSCVYYTIFFVVKLYLYIRALLLDHILDRENTTRTPRVHLVIHFDAYSVKDIYCI